MASTISNVPPAIAAFYDRNTLERAIPYLVHDKFGQNRPLPSGNSTAIKFRRFSAFAVATTALTEGVTPSGKDLAVTDVTATVAGYGDFTVITDFLDLTGLDNNIKEATDVLGEQAGQTVDIIWRDVIAAGTNAYLAANVGGRASVNTVPTTTDLDAAILALKVQNAKYFTKIDKGSTNYASTPIRPCYWAIIHPNQTFKYEALTGWKTVESYASNSEVMDNEVGSYKNIRFIETTQAKIFTGAGASSKDVYATLIFGQNAYGVVGLQGQKNITTYVKQLGSSGSADPLNQRSTVGWKAYTTAAILNNAFMIRYESTLS